MAAHEKGAWAASNTAVEKALRFVAGQPDISVGKTLGSAIFNERYHDYQGDPHELVMLHTLAMLNFSFLGQTDEALVEARAANSLMEGLKASGKVQVEDPLNRYFSAKLYERVGLWDDAYIDLKRARQAFHELEPISKVHEPSFLGGDLKRLAGKAGRKDDLKLLNEEYPRQTPALGPGQGEVWVLVFDGKTFEEPAGPPASPEDPENLALADPGLDQAMTAKLGTAETPLELVYQPALMAQEALKSKSLGESARSATRFGIRLSLLVGLAVLTQGNLPDSAGRLLASDDSQAQRWDNMPARVYACRVVGRAGPQELWLSGDGWRDKVALKVPEGKAGLVSVTITDDLLSVSLSPLLRASAQ
jgi:hypothetical protein